MGLLTGVLYACLAVFGLGWYLNYWSGNFSLLLFILTVVTFLYWLAERFYFAPRRQAAVATFEQQDAARREQLARQGIARVDDNVAATRQALAARRILLLEVHGRRAAARREEEAFGEPVREGNDRQDQQQQREVAAPLAEIPAAEKDREQAIEQSGQCAHQSFSLPLGGWPGTPLAAPRRYRSASCASCRPFVFRAACVCA